MPARNLKAPKRVREQYQKIRKIDGSHPFQDHVQGGFVVYKVRKKKQGRVAYFNFELAKEMGLINKGHEHVLSDELNEALLDTFSIQIINEYDLINKTKIPEDEKKTNHYMATRYLQLQHPNKTGLTSGDGRSIWNGVVTSANGTWDISSCGTGATCLSPASAIQKKFFETGDPTVSYGCGYSTLSEGLIDVLFSEVLNRNKVATERILCVIKYPGGMGITVRAGRNLLRPSHFFNHLKQGQIQRLQQVTDYYIQRQIENKDWQISMRSKGRYDYFLDQMVNTFAHIAASFEVNYIFCWLDWDGDNILADGGIIDYGSVRQFGLFYYLYKFDDHERWSTSILEQRQKARYIVQTFAQMVDYLKTGRKKPLSKYAKHKSTKQFDKLFLSKKRELMLHNLGFNRFQIKYLMRFKSKAVESLEKNLRFLEQVKSKKGQEKVPDGVNCDMLLNTRKLLKVFPTLLEEGRAEMLEVLPYFESQAGQREGVTPTKSMKRSFKLFKKSYIELLSGVETNEQKSRQAVLNALQKRAEIINNEDRLTGDAVCMIAEALIKKSKSVSFEELDSIVERFIMSQVMNPDYKSSRLKILKEEDAHQRFLDRLHGIVAEYKESL